MKVYRRFAPDTLVVVLLFLLPLVFFWQQTLGGKTLLPTENLYQYEPFAAYADVVDAPRIPHNHLLSDLVLQNYQWKSFIRQQLNQGEIPLWNPHQFSGIPFLAAGQHSAFYPLSVIYYVMDLPAAYGWFTVINLWLAGVFMYLFLRGLGVGRAGSALAGVIYQLNGFVIASVVFQMMLAGIVWLPLLLLMAEFILQGKLFRGQKTSIPWVVAGAFALGCNIFAGHVEITIYTLLITGYYAAARLLAQFWQAYRGAEVETSFILPMIMKRFLWLAAMFILGFGLGLLQFLPLFEFVQMNWRAGRAGLETVLSYAHPVRDLAQFLLPNFYGNPAHHSYFDVFALRTVRDLTDATGNPIAFIEWGIKNYVEGALYLGILPLFLSGLTVGVGFFQAIRGRQVQFKSQTFAFASLGVLSISFMFGLPTYAALYALPGINQLNSPFRWIYALAVCVAALAGFGLDALSRQSDKTGHYPQSRAIKRIGIVLMSLAVLALAGLLAGYIFYPQIEPQIERVFMSMTRAVEAFADARMFYSYQFMNFLIFCVMLLISGVVFWRAGHERAVRRRWQIFAVMFVAVDLMIASWGFNPASDPSLLKFTPPAIEFLLQQQGAFRYATLDDPEQRPIMNANMGMSYGLDDIRGYDSIIPAQYVNYMRAVAPQNLLDFNRIAPLYTNHNFAEALDSPLLNLLNLRYLMTHRDTILPDDLIDEDGGEYSQWELAYQDEVVAIWENHRAFPRVALIPEAAFDKNWLTKQVAELNFSNIVFPFDHVAAEIVADTGREKWINVNAREPSWLVVSETYMPGWRAFARAEGGEDGEIELELQPIFGNFQATRLPVRDEGASENLVVRMVYSPTSFQVGAFGSALSILALALMAGMWFWRAFVGVNTDQSSTTARVARNSFAPIILNLLSRGIDFIFAMIMLRILSAEEVGIYNFAIVIFVWFDIFTNFGLDLLLIREVARARERAGHFFYNTGLLRLLLSVIGIPLIIAFMSVWQTTITNPISNEGLIAIVLLYIGLFPASLSKGMTSLFYAYERAEYPAAIATITTINKAILGVIVLLLGYGIIGLAAVSIINNLITFIVLVYSGRALIGKIVEKRPHFLLIRSMVKESLPLLLNHFLATIFFQVDIVILQALKGAAVNALYSVSYKWLLAINIIPAFFTQALFPVMSRQAKEDREALRRNYSLGIKILFALAMPVAVAFTFLAEILTAILGGAQYLPDGAIALQIMIWSIPIGWMNSLTQYLLIAIDLQRMITRAFFAAVFFNIVTNLIFIPQFGFRAAAVTTIASELCLFIAFGVLLRRNLGSVRWFELMWRPLIATGAMITVVYAGWQIQAGMAVVLGSMIYPVILLALRPLSDAELALLQATLPGRIQNNRIFALIVRSSGMG